MIQFTMKKEIDGKLSFLDIMIPREIGGSIKTNWHGNSGRVLNYNS